MRMQRLRWFAAGLSGLVVMFAVLLGVELFQRTLVA